MFCKQSWINIQLSCYQSTRLSAYLFDFSHVHTPFWDLADFLAFPLFSCIQKLIKGNQKFMLVDFSAKKKQNTSAGVKQLNQTLNTDT